MLVMWISSQNLAQHARSSLATTELSSSLARLGHERNDRSNDGDAKKKTLYYTPWNGRFVFWYNGHWIVFRCEIRAGEFSTREELSISCFSRSPRILRELLTECRNEYLKLFQDKTSLYEHEDGDRIRSITADVRHISTVILHESTKGELLKDIGGFLDQTARNWYSNRGIPYRRGYLLYGPPGTGKSSLSLSIAGHFDLDIYIVSVSAVNEGNLKSLFASLPSRCVVLLEDIDAVSSERSRDAEKSKSVGGKVPLSALLNIIDGVASQEGRVLIMTTNYIERLDAALIRPGRVDKKVELGLADSKMTVDFFSMVFTPREGDVTLPKNAQSDGLVELGENERVPEAARSQEEEVKKVERLAEAFAAKVPELEFSPAEISSFLLDHRQSPEEAIDNVEAWMARIREERKEAKNDV
jgi:chaperone BCS1